jgi:hypothetical protein
VFGFLLIYLLDSRFTFRIDVRALSPESVIGAAAAYREVLVQEDCRIISVRKNPERGRVTFIIRSSQADICKRLEDTWESKIHESYRGSVDWEIA